MKQKRFTEGSEEYTMIRTSSSHPLRFVWLTQIVPILSMVHHSH